MKAKYFMLKPKGKDPGAVASREAMFTYAESIECVNPELATELREWASDEAVAAIERNEDRSVADHE